MKFPPPKQPAERPLLMAAVRCIRECQPAVWTALGVFLLQAGWPEDQPTASPEERALAWLALARRARINQAPQDPNLERARRAADRIFDVLGRAIYGGTVLAAVESDEVADWIELGGGRVLRAISVHFASDLDNPRIELIAKNREHRQQLKKQHDLLPGADRLPPMPEAFMGPFCCPVPTASGVVQTTLLEEKDFGPYDHGEVEALFEELKPPPENLEERLAKLTRLYRGRVAQADNKGQVPTVEEDVAWANKQGYTRNEIRHVRGEHPNPKLHSPGRPKRK